MKWMVLAGISCILQVCAFESKLHGFSIDIPNDWKITEHSNKHSKKLEPAFSAHSKNTCTVFFDRFYEQSLHISMTNHRAQMNHEDLEGPEAQRENLLSLEHSLKSQVKTRVPMVNPIKSKRYFQQNGNYYFVLEFVNEGDHFLKEYGVYYQVYTPSAIYGITLLSPKEEIYKKQREQYQNIVLSLRSVK